MDFFRKCRIAFSRELSMANLSDRAARVYGDSVMAVVEELPPYPLFSRNEITYKQFAAAVNQVGHAFRRLGIQRHDRVMVFKTNHFDTLAVLYAIYKIGAIAVPINPRVGAEVAARIAQHAKPVAVVTDQAHVRRTGLTQADFGPVAHWISGDTPEATPPGYKSLGALIDGMPATLEGVYLQDEAIVALLHTSGTTGFPKLVMQSNQGLLTQGRRGALMTPVGHKDKVIACIPWVHVLAVGSSVVTLISGLKAYCFTEFNTTKVLEAIERERATIFVGYPTMFTWMSEELRRKPYNLDSIRYWHVGADAMHAVHIEEFTRYGAFFRLFGRKLIGSAVTPGFGMSELGGPVMMPLWFSFSWVIPRCMGRQMRLLGQVKVGDQFGRPVPRGQVGYLWVKAPGMLKGYWNRHESYMPNISNGFFRTGDVVRQDERGRFFFLDRESDVIHTQTGPVYSLEVEEVLLRTPDVLEISVIGVIGPTGSEVPLAIGYLREGSRATAADILDWARKHLPARWVPADVVLVRREELPLGPTLKVQKYKLRERYAGYFHERSGQRADVV
jgi:long-chain acyl-CoA synthetase